MNAYLPKTRPDTKLWDAQISHERWPKPIQTHFIFVDLFKIYLNKISRKGDIKRKRLIDLANYVKKRVHV
ncbi:hypothetical protein BpHYR1_017001 [Brachionus plicatilis]|uniref:Uncharacterized protein n=1 Tax=Brachionus plicatilis TaxID=10195 RepID=A0A3M7Q604_BRAPC|nr:hypothetical protein BpHYR1_017001 [Brachionus plicatilis]